MGGRIESTQLGKSRCCAREESGYGDGYERLRDLEELECMWKAEGMN
jgi:hypothetical protein